ncbi:MAG TPA: hypothetical protein VN812_16925, partial [Candidatus Acidoferrales bacterium]|nr:hypothetical protein [Candidatus Acidoferrales bacterium]
ELLHDEPQRQRLARGGYQKVVAEFDRNVNIRVLADLFLHGGVREDAAERRVPGAVGNACLPR